MFSVKRGSLSSGNGSESSCPFPWKQCGERKEQERGRNMFVWVGSKHYSNLRRGMLFWTPHEMNRHGSEHEQYVNVICSLTHLSAILAHIGLASNHRPDIIIQTPAKCDTKCQSCWGWTKKKTKQQNMYHYIIYIIYSPNLQTDLVYHIINISQGLSRNMKTISQENINQSFFKHP